MATAGEERMPVPVLEREIKRATLNYVTGGVRWGTPLKRSSFIATLANPAARNSAILPVFTMWS